MARHYKLRRVAAPPLEEILEFRKRGDSFADIGDTFGCDRRTVYSALDRAASLGQLSPVALMSLFPGERAAQKRLFAKMQMAHNAGLAVPDWHLIEKMQAKKASVSPGR